MPLAVCFASEWFPVLLRQWRSAVATLQTDGEPCATRCPSRGRMGGLYLVSLVWSGRLRCRYRSGDVSYRPPDGDSHVSAALPADRWNISMLTCWLISTMPMSFRSVVNLSNVASIVALSVLLSTTRKFFCESGGWVTC